MMEGGLGGRRRSGDLARFGGRDDRVSLVRQADEPGPQPHAFVSANDVQRRLGRLSACGFYPSGGDLEELLKETRPQVDVLDPRARYDAPLAEEHTVPDDQAVGGDPVAEAQVGEGNPGGKGNGEDKDHNDGRADARSRCDYPGDHCVEQLDGAEQWRQRVEPLPAIEVLRCGHRAPRVGRAPRAVARLGRRRVPGSRRRRRGCRQCR